MNADEITGERVHILLRRRGIQQQELADVLGVTQTAVSRKILGKRSWTLDELLATAKFLDVPITELLPGNDYAPVLTGRGRSADDPLSQHSVRPKRLELPTFCLGANAPAPDAFWTADRKSGLLAIERQLAVDVEFHDIVVVS